MRRMVLRSLMCFALVAGLAASAAGDVITATSTATLVTDPGPHEGWLYYEIVVSWNLSNGLSHWDLILKDGCKSLDHLIEFDTPAGYSNSENEPDNPNALHWTGFFDRAGDDSVDVGNAVVKYNNPVNPLDPSDEPGKTGSGTFGFYANIFDETVSAQPLVIAKAGETNTLGNLTGAYPSCTITPEPAAIGLLGLGALALLKRKRKS